MVKDVLFDFAYINFPILIRYSVFIVSAAEDPLLVAGMNAALLLVLVMFHLLDVLLNCCAAHFSSGSDIVAS